MDAADAKTKYAEAKRMFRAGQHAEALAVLRAIETEAPGAKEVLLAQAECLVALQDTDAARNICDRILAQDEDARARRILGRCAKTPPPLPARNDPIEDFEAPEPEQKRSKRFAWFAIGAVVVVVIGVAVKSNLNTPDPNRPGVHRPAAPAARAVKAPPKPSADPVADYAKLLEERKAQRDAAKSEAEAKLAAEQEAARQKPGYVVPPEEWNLDPNTGVPEWRPGVYQQLPIPGSWFEKWQGPRTLDMYIPIAYAERPEELFPTATIIMPHLNPGFLGLEPWAERRGVILVVINTSSNEFFVSGNTEAQIAAMNFLYGHLRTHPTINFAIGMSGGARMAQRAASRWPEAFAGLLMMAHSGDDLPLDPRLRVGIIYGHDDFNAPYIPNDAADMRARGLEVRVQVIPGGHITAPASEQVKMLDWMLDAARRDLKPAAEETEQAEN